MQTLTAKFNVNLHWLLMGKGKMLLDDKSILPITTKTPVDLERLVAAVISVEKALAYKKISLTPEKHAQFITLTYHIYDDGADIERIGNNIIRFIRKSC